MTENTTIITIVILAVLNIPIYILIGKVFFGDFAGFLTALKFWFTPDVFSLFKGRYWDDTMAEMKLGVFIFVCGLCVYGEYKLILKLFG